MYRTATFRYHDQYQPNRTARTRVGRAPVLYGKVCWYGWFVRYDAPPRMGGHQRMPTEVRAVRTGGTVALSALRYCLPAGAPRAMPRVNSTGSRAKAKEGCGHRARTGRRARALGEQNGGSTDDTGPRPQACAGPACQEAGGGRHVAGSGQRVHAMLRNHAMLRYHAHPARCAQGARGTVSTFLIS